MEPPTQTLSKYVLLSAPKSVVFLRHQSNIWVCLKTGYHGFIHILSMLYILDYIIGYHGFIIENPWFQICFVSYFLHWFYGHDVLCRHRVDRCVFRPPVLGAGTLLARLLNTWDGTNTYNHRRDMMKLPCCNHVLRKSKVWTFRTAFSPWNIATVDFSDSPCFNGHKHPICLLDAMSYPICLMAN